MTEREEDPEDDIIILPTNVGNFGGNEKFEDETLPQEGPMNASVSSDIPEIRLEQEKAKQKEIIKQKLKSHSVKDIHTWVKSVDSSLKSAGTTPSGAFKESSGSKLEFSKSVSVSERIQSNSATTSPARKSSPMVKERPNFKEDEERKSLLDEGQNCDEIVPDLNSITNEVKINIDDDESQSIKNEGPALPIEESKQRPIVKEKKKGKKRKNKKKMPVINEEDEEGKVRDSSELFKKRTKKKKTQQPAINLSHETQRELIQQSHQSQLMSFNDEHGSPQSEKNKEKSSFQGKKRRKDDALTYEKIRSRELEDKIIGWNMASYLMDRRVPKYNKLFLFFILISFLASTILSSMELNYFSITSCQDSYNHGMVYFNFFLTICYKFALMNFVNLEVFHSMPLELNYPFLVPILGYGVFPVMQMPQYSYDFIICRHRGSIFSLADSYNMADLFGYFQIILIALFLMIAGVSTTCTIPNRMLKQGRNVGYFFIVIITFATNFVSILLSFSQAEEMVPSMFLENITYWFLVITLIYCLCRKRYWKVDVFGPITEESQQDTKSVSIKSNSSSQTGSFNLGNMVVMKGAV